jgi:hypothetical protein
LETEFTRPGNNWPPDTAISPLMSDGRAAEVAWNFSNSILIPWREKNPSSCAIKSGPNEMIGIYATLTVVRTGVVGTDESDGIWETQAVTITKENRIKPKIKSRDFIAIINYITDSTGKSFNNY